MLTPVFEITQDSAFLTITIRAPLAKVSECEITFDEKELLFSAPPYFLRLFLPCDIVENGQEKGSYDADKSLFILLVPKKTLGEHFPGLDMITRLLAPPGGEHVNLIHEEEDIDSNCPDSSTHDVEDEAEEREDDNFNWYAEQTVAPHEEEFKSISKSTGIGPKTDHQFAYGFAERHSGVFGRLKEEIAYIFDVSEPDLASHEERVEGKTENEKQCFSEDHYMADYMDLNDSEGCSTLNSVLEFEPPWKFHEESKKWAKLDDSEKARLKEMPRNFESRIGKLDAEETEKAICSLIDIIFAFAYDYRTTLGEHNVESGWTIAKLSGTLSWLLWGPPAASNGYTNTLLSSFRRSIAFPLFRNWKLCQQVKRDVEDILDGGPVCVLKCLLAIHGILSTSGEYRYIFNELYITDYCLWIQYTDENLFKKTAKELRTIKVRKSDFADLEELELAAELTLKTSLTDENNERETTFTQSNNEFLKSIARNAQIISPTDFDSDDD